MPLVQKHHFNYIKWFIILTIVCIFIYFTSKVQFNHFNNLLEKGPIYIGAYAVSWVLFVGFIYIINNYCS